MRKAAPRAVQRTIARSSLALVGAAIASFACAHPPPLPPPPADSSPSISAAEREANEAAARTLFTQVRAAHEKPRTVSGDAKAFVDAAQNGGRYALLFAIERPDSLRIDALMPWGEPAASLVTQNGKLLFRDDRSKQFYRGASTPKNLSLLLPAPLADTELIAILSGALPELPGGEPSMVEEAGDGKRRLTLRTLPAGLSTLRGIIETALIEKDLTVLQVSRFIERGKSPELLWAATLEEQGGAGAPGLPGLIHFHIAAQSVGQPRDVEIDLRLKNLSADHAPPASAFVLLPPPGMPIVELDQVH